MIFLALHDDVKFIISKQLASDLKIRELLSKNHDLQQILFDTYTHTHTHTHAHTHAHTHTFTHTTTHAHTRARTHTHYNV